MMNNRKTFLFLAILSLSLVQHVLAQPAAIIPQPDQVEWGSGSYELKKSVTIGYETQALRPAAVYLSEILTRATGSKVKVRQGSGNIVLGLSGSDEEGQYRLTVGKKGVEIIGSDYNGVAYGIATLRQLLPPESEVAPTSGRRRISLPAVSIDDRPRYSWRGMHLDSSRHFFSADEVKEYLDVLSLYKLNRFHWHLTDDQGWRIEIKKYPLLTERGGWRTPNNHDSTCMRRAIEEDNPDFLLPEDKFITVGGERKYGGFYTQDEIRDIVEYARVRGIEIVPEIDVPGHSLCAIDNYEGLSCFERTGWGELYTTPLCPGKDKTIEFLKDVYTEIFDLFPSKYIHIGGDEVDMTHWKACPDCQRRMKEHNLTSEAQLEAWILGEMEEFFRANGREMIGWDEILDGGLSPTSIVMWWRNWSPSVPKRTVAHGNRIIFTPGSTFYFDGSDRQNTMEKVYNYQGTTEGLTSEQQKLVLGVQGNVWAEFIPSRERVFYQAFPRGIAVAELGWSKPSRMDYKDFCQRLQAHFPRLQAMDVTYNQPHLSGFYESNASTRPMSLNIDCLDTSVVVRYTTDGTFPQITSPVFGKSMVVNETTDFKLRTFAKNGKKGDVVDVRVVVRDYAPSVDAHPTQTGLKAAWHDFRGNTVRDVDKAPLNGIYEIADVGIPSEVGGNIGLVLTGYMDLPGDDIYLFELTSDDGSCLILDGEIVVDNDGPHSMLTHRGQYPLKAGLHKMEVRYFDSNGGGLQLAVYDSKGNKLDPARIYRH